MKKREVFIIALLLAVAAAGAVLIVSKLDKPARPSGTTASAAAPAASEPSAPLPEPGTVYLDKENNVSATVGVAAGDGEMQEEPEDAPPSPKPEEPAPYPTPTEEPGAVPEEPGKIGYEEFYALTPEQKDAFLNSFESYEAFYEWLTAAQSEFAQAHPDFEIGPGGMIDLSQFGQ